MLWSTTGRQLIKVTPLTSASCPPESPIVRQSGSQACQHSDYCFPTQTLHSHSHAKLFHSSLSWYFMSHQHLLLRFPRLLILQDLCLLSLLSLISPHLEFIRAWARRALSPTLLESMMLPVSAIFGAKQALHYCPCFESLSHELRLAKSDGENMRAEMGNYTSAI